MIIGAGIIGSATAYYLSESPSTTSPEDIHLIESSPELFASASGYAAGFLARDWFSPTVASLGALSFDLHKQLALQHDGSTKWGHSKSTAASLQTPTGKRGDEWLREDVSRAEAAAEHDLVRGRVPNWLKRRIRDDVEIMSDGDNTAQVFVSIFGPTFLVKVLSATW